MSPITVRRGTDDGEAQVFRLTQTVLQTGHSRGRLMSFYDNDKDDWWSNQGADDAPPVGDPSRGLSPSPPRGGVDVDEPEHEEALTPRVDTILNEPSEGEETPSVDECVAFGKIESNSVVKPIQQEEVKVKTFTFSDSLDDIYDHAMAA